MSEKTESVLHINLMDMVLNFNSFREYSAKLTLLSAFLCSFITFQSCGSVSSTDLQTVDSTSTLPPPTNEGELVTLSIPADIQLNADETEVYILDTGLAALVKANLENGQMQEVSGTRRGNGVTLAKPTGLTLSANGTTAYVVDDDLDGLLEIDLATGNRQIISSAMQGGGPQFSRPSAVAFGGSNTVFVLKSNSEAV